MALIWKFIEVQMDAYSGLLWCIKVFTLGLVIWFQNVQQNERVKVQTEQIK